MLNQIQSESSLRVIAPAGGVIGGNPYAFSKLAGFVVADAAAGEYCTLKTEGVYLASTKKVGEAWNVGDALYLITDGTFTITTDATAPHVAIGHAASAQLAADTTGEVLLLH